LDGALQQKKVHKFVDKFYVKDMKRDIVAECNIVPTKEKSMLGGLFGKK
jgi:hypothetical protein